MAERETEEHNDGTETIAKAVGAVAGAAIAAWGIYKFFTGLAIAAWGIYKFFTGSLSSNNTDKVAHEPPLGHFESKAIVGLRSEPIAREALLVKWSLPQKGWVKINTDASLKSNPSSVAIGGVIRNDKGVWMDGFALRIPSCTIPQAELWAVKEGLMIARNRGFRKIEVETDSKIALRLIKREQKASNDLEEQLIQECTDLLRNVQVDIKHCFREANGVADYMAKFGHSLIFNKITCFDKPPDETVVYLLDRDLEE